MMQRRRFWRIAAGLLVIASPAAGCNALNGSQDRALENDARAPSDAGADVRDDLDARTDTTTTTTDAADASVLEIAVSKTFITLNGASFVTTASGTTITATDAGPPGAHGVVVPSPQPIIPGSDFTLIATVLAQSAIEFGVITRMESGAGGGRAFVFGSRGSNPPFLSTFAPSAWEPVQPFPSIGAASGFSAGARYKLSVRSAGTRVTAKLWDASMIEPGDSIAATLDGAGLPAGRGIGFYVYNYWEIGGMVGDASIANPPVLESLRVTVP